MSQPHTGKIFKDTILDTIEGFNIAKKFLSLSTDNASNMIHGFDLLASEMLMKYDQNIKYIKNALDYADWKILEENIPILKVFAEATNVLSTFKRPTLHQVDEIFHGIQVYLKAFKTNASKSMIEKIHDYSTKLSDAHW